MNNIHLRQEITLYSALFGSSDRLPMVKPDNLLSGSHSILSTQEFPSYNDAFSCNFSFFQLDYPYLHINMTWYLPLKKKKKSLNPPPLLHVLTYPGPFPSTISSKSHVSLCLSSFTTQSLFNPLHLGFCPHSATDTIMVKVINDIHVVKNNGQFCSSLI